MTTNREWLYSLDVADLADWFDAQHVDANDVSTRKGDVRADGVCANDVSVSQDSREKLEEDVSQYVLDAWAQGWEAGQHDDMDCCNFYIDEMRALLDRQAAITERECTGDAGKASLMGVVAHERECYDKRIAELTAQVDELSQQLTNARADCEQYRELFSKAITHAHEIVNLQP